MTSTVDHLLSRHFHAAVAATQCIQAGDRIQPNPQQRFQCYGLYKQATEGSCTSAPPPELDSLAAWKHQAWASQGHKSQSAAKFEYACIIFGVLVEGASRGDHSNALTSEQQAFVDSFNADASQLRALRISADGHVQSVDESVVTPNAYFDAAQSSFLTLASPTLFATEQWQRGCVASVLRVLAALVLRVALAMRSLAVLLCPFRQAARRMSALVGASFEFFLACIYLVAIVLGLWPHGPRTSAVPVGLTENTAKSPNPPAKATPSTPAHTILLSPPASLSASKAASQKAFMTSEKPNQTVTSHSNSKNRLAVPRGAY